MKVVKLLKCCQLHGVSLLYHAKYRSLMGICLLLLLWSSSNVVYVTVMRYIDMPTLILRSEKTRTRMEFPAVLLYPEIAYPEYKIDAFLSDIKFPPHLNEGYIRKVLQQLAAYYSPDMDFIENDLNNVINLLDYNHIDIDTVARRLTVSCEEALIKCRLFDKIMDCTKLFRMELTGYGYACVFNGRSLSREIKKYGVHVVKPKTKFYTMETGFGSGLMFVVNQSSVFEAFNLDLEYKWVAADGGQNYVDSTVNGTPLSPGVEMWVRHSLNGFHLTDDAKNLNVEMRGCRLVEDETKLFPIYHKKHCFLECEMAHVFRECQCSMLSYPALPGRYPCSPHQLRCARQAAVALDKDRCKCIHTCNVDQDVVVITSNALIPGSQHLDTFYDDLDFHKISIVRAFIEKRMVFLNERHSVYNPTDLFSQLGGAFNLFFGCSILSVLEILQLIKYGFMNWHSKAEQKRKNDTFNKTKQRKKKQINDIDGNKIKIKKKVRFSLPHLRYATKE